MSEDVTQVTEPEGELDGLNDDGVDVEAKTVALGSSIKLKPLRGDVVVDFADPGRETLKPRVSKEGKVFTNGFKVPGFSAYTDLPGKVCVGCGFRALKFSTACSKCGGQLIPE